jgi:hypothetical protein
VKQWKDSVFLIIITDINRSSTGEYDDGDALLYKQGLGLQDPFQDSKLV